MDFVMDALDNGRRLKCLTIVDDFTKESIDIVVDHSIPGLYVTRVLDQAAQVLNNYLTPGLRTKSGAYRIALGINNSMNQANMGLSAFHLTGEAIRSVMNRGALGLKDLFQGSPVRGSVRLATWYQRSKVAPLNTSRGMNLS